MAGIIAVILFLYRFNIRQSEEYEKELAREAAAEAEAKGAKRD